MQAFLILDFYFMDETWGKNLFLFPANPSCQLHVLWHDGDTLGMDSAEVCIFKELYKISLTRLLQGHHCGTLEAQIRPTNLCNLTHKPLEGVLMNKQCRSLLILSDLPEGNSAWSVAVGPLDSSTWRDWIAICFWCQKHHRTFSSDRFHGSLLGTSHRQLSLLRYGCGLKHLLAFLVGSRAAQAFKSVILTLSKAVVLLIWHSFDHIIYHIEVFRGSALLIVLHSKLW